MKTDTNPAPRARNENLVVKELANEALIYDLERHTAHCLNHTAFLVWKQCDGTRTVSDIAAQLTTELALPVGDDLIWVALEQLSKDRLLAESIKRPRAMTMAGAGVSRRRMLKRMGIAAAIAVPVVTSLVVPPVSVHASVACPPACTVAGGECVSCGKTCISGTCM